MSEEPKIKEGKLKIKTARIGAKAVVIAAIISAIISVIGVIIAKILPDDALGFQKRNSKMKEELVQIQTSLKAEQEKSEKLIIQIEQIKAKRDSLDQELKECKEGNTDWIKLIREGERIKERCSQSDIGKDFDKWKTDCIRLLAKRFPDIQKNIEEIIARNPLNNYCTNAGDIVSLIKTLKNQ